MQKCGLKLGLGVYSYYGTKSKNTPLLSCPRPCSILHSTASCPITDLPGELRSPNQLVEAGQRTELASSHYRRQTTHSRTCMESRQFRRNAHCPKFPTHCTEAPRRSSAIHVLAFRGLATRPWHASLDTCEKASASDPPMQYVLPVHQKKTRRLPAGKKQIEKTKKKKKSEKSMMMQDIRTPNALPACCCAG